MSSTNHFQFCIHKKLEGLKNCRNLKKLYLYSNQLNKIQNLEQLNLDVLWLNDNKISIIEVRKKLLTFLSFCLNNFIILKGLSHMSDLIDLNLAKNAITNIGNILIHIILYLNNI